MSFHVSHALSCTALALGLVGCGELADQHTAPPVLMTFQGSLSVAADSAAPTATIRVALLWHIPLDQAVQCSASSDENGVPFEPARGEGSLLLDSIQQAIDVTPQFPSAFHLDVREPPPEKALYEHVPSDPADTRKVMQAQASFVVYVDGNNNGKLDARSDTTASPDQVLSARSSFALLTLDPRTSPLPPTYFIIYSTEGVDGLQPGYNLLADGANGGVLDPESEIQLELRSTPGLQAETCLNECLPPRTPTNDDCPADPRDLPPIPSDAERGYTANLDNGADAWTWRSGPDSFVYEARECFRLSLPDPEEDSYSFISLRVEATGCEQRATVLCRYDARGQAPASWPCPVITEYGQQQPRMP